MVAEGFSFTPREQMMQNSKAPDFQGLHNTQKYTVHAGPESGAGLPLREAAQTSSIGLSGWAYWDLVWDQGTR